MFRGPCHAVSRFELTNQTITSFKHDGCLDLQTKHKPSGSQTTGLHAQRERAGDILTSCLKGESDMNGV